MPSSYLSLPHPVLSIVVPEYYHPDMFSVADTSLYPEDFRLSDYCPSLHVIPPGFSKEQVNVIGVSDKNETYRIDACVLGIQSSGCDTELNILPDGVYEIIYSVSETYFVAYDYLRVANMMLSYYDVLCCMDSSGKGFMVMNSEDVKGSLYRFRMFVDMAKAKVEVCKDRNGGMFFYNEAFKVLRDLKCRYCGGCR